jgi:hypothetical protein
VSTQEVVESPDALGPPAVPTTPDERRARIGWGRAILTGVAIVVVAFLGAIWLPDLILRQFSSVSRDTRTLVAATVSVVVVLAIAWALRRLQSRGAI